MDELQMLRTRCGEMAAEIERLHAKKDAPDAIKLLQRVAASTTESIAAKTSQKVQGDFHHAISVWYVNLTNADDVQDGENVNGKHCTDEMLDELERILAKQSTAVSVPSTICKQLEIVSRRLEKDELWVLRDTVNLAISALQSPRITEQDAREIVESWLTFNSGQLEGASDFNWGEFINEDGRSLLAKLNAGKGEVLQVPDWLMEMSKKMRDQDNRGTSHPFFQVRCKEYLPTDPDCCAHHWEIVGDDGVVCTQDESEGFVDYILSNHAEWCKQWNEQNHGEDSDREALESWFNPADEELPDPLRLIWVQEVEKVVSTHLTEAAALQFIERKQHDYPKLYTYAESAYWSPQLRQLQDWIAALSAAPKHGVEQ